VAEAEPEALNGQEKQSNVSRRISHFADNWVFVRLFRSQARHSCGPPVEYAVPRGLCGRITTMAPVTQFSTWIKPHYGNNCPPDQGASFPAQNSSKSMVRRVPRSKARRERRQLRTNQVAEVRFAQALLAFPAG